MLSRKLIGMNLDGYAHPHMLGALHDLTGYLLKITLFQSLETKVIKQLKITAVIDHLLDSLHTGNFADLLRDNSLGTKHLGTLLECSRSILVMIINRNTSSQLTAIGVSTTNHHSRRLRCKIVQLSRLNPVVNLGTDLLCDQNRVHMFETNRKCLNAMEDLIKRDLFTASVTLGHVHLLTYITRHTLKWS